MKTVSVALVWHFHQPDYGLPGENRSLLPWVRLHATKSYYDLPWLIARHPHIRATINVSGSLLRQLSAYVHHNRDDTWWELSRRDPADLSPSERAFVAQNFFAVHPRIVAESARYSELRELRDRAQHPLSRMADADIRDLQVLFNLAWMGFAAREESVTVQSLVEKGRSFSESDKQALFNTQATMLRSVLEQLRWLAEEGRIELTTTPGNHPILPLIVDSDAAKRASPSRPLPPRFQWEEDAHWHVGDARDRMTAELGVQVAGMWPGEGSVSPEVVPIFAAAGVRWIASDEDVLMRSTGRPPERADALCRAYRLPAPEGDVAIVFRDHTMSDLVGFTYATNAAEQAAADLVKRIADLGRSARHTEHPLVSVILDGENPWEAYPDDGRPFMEALYRQLSPDNPAAEGIVTTTPRAFLDEHPASDTLGNLHSGSWINANYDIWIGADETNRAWELLGRTRQFFEEQREHASEEAAAMAWQSITSAEGSDWFWWYGDDFSSQNDAEFDDLFRHRLRAVYRAMGYEPPTELWEPIASSPIPTAFTPPRAKITPNIDGRVASFYEWVGAGRYEVSMGAGSMMRVHHHVSSVLFGFDEERFYCRVDFTNDLAIEPGTCVRLSFRLREGGELVAVAMLEDGNGDVVAGTMVNSEGEPIEETSYAFGSVLELAVPTAAFDGEPGSQLGFAISVVVDTIAVERHPVRSFIDITVPDETFDGRNWIV